MSQTLPDKGSSRTRADAARREGHARFEAGDFPGARAAFERAFAAGDTAPETVDALHALYADAGDAAALARMLLAALDRIGADLPAAERVGWAAASLDAAVAADLPPEERAAAALRLLELAAEAGEPGWPAVMDPARRPRVVAAFAGPSATLERLEQEGYAPPETGLPALAALEAEELGHRHATEPTVARAAERLLHGFGHRDAAYRVEATRRAAARRATGAAGGDGPPAGPALRGLAVVVAGGHPALRRQVRADLARSGVTDLREIPPAWEASRPARAIRDLLTDADVAVLVWRQLPHSTADRVQAAAARLEVPVVRARTAGAASVREAVEEFARRAAGARSRPPR